MSMRIAKNWGKVALITGGMSVLYGCASYNPEKAKVKSTELRKQELCREIATRDQPQCTRHYTPEP